MTAVVPLENALKSRGFALLPAAAIRPLLERAGPLDDWSVFAASWSDLGLDTYMADGGRYRKRRHAVFSARRDGITRLAHQPHYQGRDYNNLNGGIDRWFEPVAGDIGSSQSLTTILAFCHDCFCKLAPETRDWLVEVHQFRIEVSMKEGSFRS